MDLLVVRRLLQEVASNFDVRDSTLVGATLKRHKAEAVKAGDQECAKELWCLEEILEIQDRYIAAFHLMKSKQYYEAWRSLEQTEIAFGFLAPHFQDHNGEFHLDFIEKHTLQYQSLFPYKMFISPEILATEKECTNCGRVVSIRNSCGHRIGEVYDGEMCARRVTKCKILGISLADHPVQKYSVLFPKDEKGCRQDPFDYSLVKYLLERLDSPFHGWEVSWTKRRHPHSFFCDVGRNDPCPCESGRKYKRCCLLEAGVLRPHCQFSFAVPPLVGTEEVQYVY